MYEPDCLCVIHTADTLFRPAYTIFFFLRVYVRYYILSRTVLRPVVIRTLLTLVIRSPGNRRRRRTRRVRVRFVSYAGTANVQPADLTMTGERTARIVSNLSARGEPFISTSFRKIRINIYVVEKQKKNERRVNNDNETNRTIVRIVFVKRKPCRIFWVPKNVCAYKKGV